MPKLSATPLFSVIIPLYNRRETIGKAIESVLAQSEQDFELIIIDDGSTDNPQSVVKTFKDERIRFIQQKNAGSSTARNHGIKAANGQYIAFLDSDDIFLPHHLAQAIPTLTQSKKTCTYTQVIVDRGNDIRFLKPSQGLKPEEHISTYLMCNRGFVPTITLIVPSDLAKKVLYNEALNFGDDYDFAIRLYAAGATLIMLPQPSAIWYDHYIPTRLSQHTDILNQCIQWIEQIKPHISHQAYLGEQGWVIAKAYAYQGKRFTAFRLYLQALFHGCYGIKSALIIFLQIMLPQKTYRRFADTLARIGINP